MLLRCPICKKPLETEGRSCRCENRHCFDFAKSGYLNLSRSSQSGSGDNADMVRARTAFLEGGCYSFLRDELKKILEEEPVTVFADLGCGEGYYTSVCPGSEKYGFDLSKAAITHASKHDKSTLYAVAGIFDLPLPDSCADAVLTCFAPAAKDEILRVLKPGGRFVFVLPAKRHLFELKEVLYDSPYENDEVFPDLPLEYEKELRTEQLITVSKESLLNLFQMTPYAWKTGKEGLARLEALDALDLTASFVIRIYRKAG